MKKSNEKEVNIKIVFTKKLLIVLFAGMVLILFCMYLLIMTTVNHRNPFNGLKYVPSNMVKIPIASNQGWKIDESTATKKLEKSGFDVKYIYDGPVSDNKLVGKCIVDPLVDNKNVIQHYQKKKYGFENSEDKIKYGYDVKEGDSDYAAKGSTIIVRVQTNDMDKITESHDIDY